MVGATCQREHRFNANKPYRRERIEVVEIMEFCELIEKYAKSFERKMKIEKKSPNTLLAYSRTYRDFVQFCQEYDKELTFENLKEEDVYAFLDYKSLNMKKQGDISESTSNALVVHLKRLFKHIERNSDQLYDFDRVFGDIKLRQPVRKAKGLDGASVQKLLDYMESLKSEESFIDFRNILLFKIMLFGGLRASEVVSLKFSNISLEDSLYKFSFKGKGNKDRVSFIRCDEISDEIDMLQNTFGLKDDEYISRTSKGHHMDRVQLSKMVNSFYRKAGVNASGVHILRHTAAKRFLASGVSIVVVQSLLGHSSIQTTSIYANPTEDIVKRELGAAQ